MLAMFAAPSLLLAAAVFAGLPTTAPRRGRIARLCLAGFLGAAPTLILLLAFLFEYDDRFPRDAQPWTNGAAGVATGTLALAQPVLGAVATSMATRSGRGWLRIGGAIVGAACLIPLAFIAERGGAQALSGTSR